MDAGLLLVEVIENKTGYHGREVSITHKDIYKMSINIPNPRRISRHRLYNMASKNPKLAAIQKNRLKHSLSASPYVLPNLYMERRGIPSRRERITGGRCVLVQTKKKLRIIFKRYCQKKLH